MYDIDRVLYMNEEEHQMNWSIAQARRHFAELLTRARRKPQPIYRRSELVGAVVGPEELQILDQRRKSKKRESVAQAFSRLQEICAKERYRLVAPPCRNRRVARLPR